MFDYKQSNIDSGATPIGSAGRAPDEIIGDKEKNSRVYKPGNLQSRCFDQGLLSRFLQGVREQLKSKGLLAEQLEEPSQ